jgi:hypothetical protein
MDGWTMRCGVVERSLGIKIGAPSRGGLIDCLLSFLFDFPPCPAANLGLVVWSEGVGEGEGWSVLAIRQTGKEKGGGRKRGDTKKEERVRIATTSRGGLVFARKDEQTQECREWEEAQYQSMAQARELELETPEARGRHRLLAPLLVFPSSTDRGSTADRRLSSQCSKW